MEMAKKQNETSQVQHTSATAVQAEDNELDEWDKRIFSTGCADENAKLLDCHFEKNDWRACKNEMERFRECWKVHGNNKRTDVKDI